MQRQTQQTSQAEDRNKASQQSPNSWTTIKMRSQSCVVPCSDDPWIHCGPLVLSGNDVIEAGKAIGILRARGILQTDDRIASLMAIMNAACIESNRAAAAEAVGKRELVLRNSSATARSDSNIVSVKTPAMTNPISDMTEGRQAVEVSASQDKQRVVLAATAVTVAKVDPFDTKRVLQQEQLKWNILSRRIQVIELAQRKTAVGDESDANSAKASHAPRFTARQRSQLKAQINALGFLSEEVSRARTDMHRRQQYRALRLQEEMLRSQGELVDAQHASEKTKMIEMLRVSSRGMCMVSGRATLKRVAIHNSSWQVDSSSLIPPLPAQRSVTFAQVDFMPDHGLSPQQRRVLVLRNSFHHSSSFLHPTRSLNSIQARSTQQSPNNSHTSRYSKVAYAQASASYSRHARKDPTAAEVDHGPNKGIFSATLTIPVASAYDRASETRVTSVGTACGPKSGSDGVDSDHIRALYNSWREKRDKDICALRQQTILEIMKGKHRQQRTKVQQMVYDSHIVLRETLIAFPGVLRAVLSESTILPEWVKAHLNSFYNVAHLPEWKRFGRVAPHADPASLLCDVTTDTFMPEPVRIQMIIEERRRLLRQNRENFVCHGVKRLHRYFRTERGHALIQGRNYGTEADANMDGHTSGPECALGSISPRTTVKSTDGNSLRGSLERSDGHCSESFSQQAQCAIDSLVESQRNRHQNVENKESGSANPGGFSHFAQRSFLPIDEDDNVASDNGIILRRRDDDLLPDDVGMLLEDDTVLPALKVQTLSSLQSLVDFQNALREKVTVTISLQEVEAGEFRAAKKLLQLSRRRLRDMRKIRNEREKVKQRKRRSFLSSVVNCARSFHKIHQGRRRTNKGMGNWVMSHFDALAKREEMIIKQEERARVRALRSKDQDEYFRLVKKAKNKRILRLLRQTEDYMRRLSETIGKERSESINEEFLDEMHSISVKDDNLRELKKRRDQQLRDEAERRRNAVKQQEDTKLSEEELDNVDFGRGRLEYYRKAHELKVRITNQPSSLTFGTLRDYQLAGLQWLASLHINRLNGILADEMGLGKTIQSIALVAWLMEVQKEFGPFLVIVPMSTLHNNWVTEFDRWLPSARKVVYEGNKEQRRHVRERQMRAKDYNVLLTTYEFAMRDKRWLKEIKWKYIIIDEAHRLKNTKCKLAQDLTQYWHRSHRIALTGTPLQNDLQELWSLLNFLHPSIFNSSKSFEEWFSSPFATMSVSSTAPGSGNSSGSSMTEEEKLLVIDRLHHILRPFLLRREKSQVESQLMDKIEKVLRCRLTPAQQAMYAAVVQQKVSSNNRVMDLRKICNNPYLFHPFVRKLPQSYDYDVSEDLVHSCGKLMLLDQILRKLKATGHRVLIFNQMTKTMDILERYFALRQYTFLRLDGMTNQEERRAGLQKFNATNSEYFVYILSTKAGGLGLNLQSADTVILFDSDWNPQNDQQAQARAHRIGQLKQVLVIRLITEGTIEEQVLAKANQKLNTESLVIHAGMFNKAYHASVSREIMEQIMQQNDDDDDDDDDGSGTIVDLEAVSTAIARDEQERRVFDEMDKNLAGEFNARSELGAHGTLPVWLASWLMEGKRSGECSGNHVDIDRYEREWKIGHREELEERVNGFGFVRGKRRARKTTSYRDISDRVFNALVEKGRDGSGSDSGGDTNIYAFLKDKVVESVKTNKRKRKRPHSIQEKHVKRHHSSCNNNGNNDDS